MYWFFFKFFSHLGYYRVLSRFPCDLLLYLEGSLTSLMLFAPLLLQNLSTTSGLSDSGRFIGTDSPSWKPLSTCRHQTKQTIWFICLWDQNEHYLNPQLETKVHLGVIKPGTDLCLFEINKKEREAIFCSCLCENKFLCDGGITRFFPFP